VKYKVYNYTYLKTQANLELIVYETWEFDSNSDGE